MPACLESQCLSFSLYATPTINFIDGYFKKIFPREADFQNILKISLSLLLPQPRSTIFGLCFSTYFLMSFGYGAIIPSLISCRNVHGNNSAIPGNAKMVVLPTRLYRLKCWVINTKKSSLYSLSSISSSKLDDLKYCNASSRASGESPSTRSCDTTTDLPSTP